MAKGCFVVNAKEMFYKLNFKCDKKNNYCIQYSKEFEEEFYIIKVLIIFTKKNDVCDFGYTINAFYKSDKHHYDYTVKPKEHLAVHQQMKELGWIGKDE